jgi:hypothetical protein
MNNEQILIFNIQLKIQLIKKKEKINYSINYNFYIIFIFIIFLKLINLL